VDFSLTPEQTAIQEAARSFALGEVEPIVDEIDEAQRFPHEVMKKAGELGFLGVIFPEEVGGAGLGYVEYVLVVTELSKVDPSVGISVAAHNSLCTNHIYKFGNDEQRRRWVTPLARGEQIGAWSLTEPGAGSDAAGTRSHAEKVDGGWILNGSKTFTTHGSVGDVCVVFAVTDPDGRRHHNISAFVLEKGMEGFRPGKKENKLGIRASDTSEVIMENCFVPDENLLGERGEGFIQALQILDGGRISIAALGLGTAIGAFDTAVAYAKERQQFGKPLAAFQAISHYLADAATLVSGGTTLAYEAAWARSEGRSVERLAPMAKLFACQTYRDVTAMAEQVWGGVGFTIEYDIQLYFRRAKQLQLAWWDTRHLEELIAASALDG
jgi:hypothetical protein